MGAFEGAVLDGLLGGNQAHVGTLTDDTFRGIEDEQHPDVVTVCCADSRVPQERMWSVNEPGTLFTPSTIGNQAWDLDGEERIIDGGVAYAVHHAGVEAVVVVGHTGCGAIKAAYNVADGHGYPGPRGVDLWIEQLEPVVQSAINDGLLDGATTDRQMVNRLVEHNVDHQVAFLRDDSSIPDDVPIYGFVYDFQGAYGSTSGTCYLVNLNGTTEPERIADALPKRYRHVAKSLIH